MKRYLHWWITLLFLLALGYDLVVWGAASQLADVGPKLEFSAQRQALFAHIYMGLGSPLVSASPFLKDWGTQHFYNALSSDFPRIQEDPYVAMDLILSESSNADHAMIKLMYWAAPVFALLALILWSRRPKPLQLMRSRR